MNSRVVTFLLFCMAFLCTCREKYNPGIVSPATGYLVVEGYINSMPGSITSITLNRTTKLADTAKIVYERKAQVSLLTEKGGNFKLTETGVGVYTSAPLTLDASDRYRLRILTQGGKEYLSDYSVMRTTPPIDSINWVRDASGVEIFVNTHDDQQKTTYYRFSKEVTWEFHSPYTTALKLRRSINGQILGVDYRLPSFLTDTSLFRCWKNIPATEYLLGTSEKLTKDLIHMPLVKIPTGSWELSVLYSMLVKEYAVSREHYRFLERMKKNTESLGSIFDAQPSDAQGNIHCVTDVTEPVVGFVEVSQEQQQRIFISNTQLPAWNYNSDCAQPEEVTILKLLDPTSYVQSLAPTHVASFDDRGGILSIFMAAPICVDCTLRGVNTKPSFWP